MCAGIPWQAIDIACQRRRRLAVEELDGDHVLVNSDARAASAPREEEGGEGERGERQRQKQDGGE